MEGGLLELEADMGVMGDKTHQVARFMAIWPNAVVDAWGRNVAITNQSKRWDLRSSVDGPLRRDSILPSIDK